MAEELTRSLTMLAQRGVPRGASQVLQDARRDSAPRDAGLDSAPRRVLRPAQVAVAAFVATLVVLGGSLAFGIAMRQPGLDVGSISEAAGDVAAATSGWWLLIPAIAVAAAVVALIVSKQQVRTRKENKMTTTIERAPTERVEPPKRYKLLVGIAIVALAAAGIWWFGIRDSSTDPAAQPTADIYGMWITELEGMHVTFNEDGSWTARMLLDLEVFRDTGAFTFDGEVLTVRTDPGFECASYAEKGSYGVDFTDVDTIRLTVIDDSCTGRANDFASGLVRYSP